MYRVGAVRALNGSAVNSVIPFTRRVYYGNMPGIGSGTGTGTGTDPYGNSVLIIEKLILLMNKIQSELMNYINILKGDLSLLPTVMNQSEVLNLSNTFYSLKVPILNKTVYEEYRVFVTNFITSFNNINTFVLNCKEKSILLDETLKKASILDDVNKLTEYINNIKKNIGLFNTEVSVTKALIKEPYNTYIQLYGVPDKLLWEPDRLAYVNNLLNLNI